MYTSLLERAKKLTESGRLGVKEREAVCQVLGMVLTLIEATTASTTEPTVATAPTVVTTAGPTTATTTTSAAPAPEPTAADRLRTSTNVPGKASKKSADTNNQRAPTTKQQGPKTNTKAAPAGWTQVGTPKWHLIPSQWNVPVFTRLPKSASSGAYVNTPNPATIAKQLAEAKVANFAVISPNSFEGASRVATPTSKGPATKAWAIIVGQCSKSGISEVVLDKPHKASVTLRAVKAKAYASPVQWASASRGEPFRAMVIKCVNECAGGRRITEGNVHRCVDIYNGQVTVKVTVDSDQTLALLQSSGDRGIFFTHASAEQKLEVIQLARGTSLTTAKAVGGSWVTHTPIGLALMLPSGTGRGEVLARVPPELLPAKKAGVKFVVVGAARWEHHDDIASHLTSAGWTGTSLCKSWNGWIMRTPQTGGPTIIHRAGLPTLMVREWCREDGWAKAKATYKGGNSRVRLTDEEFPPLTRDTSMAPEESKGRRRERSGSPDHANKMMKHD
eukprot:TRINITY_DN348_c0_g2_i1.p1 TRINITY_DN348_c0_g2~~TRINITY_DN348_c0_g2_i1.p1  ORF type:complete len:504 (+),score=63.36 TRINITY_DN348_c0_g2_i1:312-1823(+)